MATSGELAFQIQDAKLELFSASEDGDVGGGVASLTGFAVAVRGSFGGELELSVESVVEIDLPGDLPKLRTTVEGVWAPPAPSSGGDVLGGRWRLTAAAALSGELAWAPLGMDSLRITNPSLRVALRSSANGSGELEIDTVEISSEETTLLGDRLALVAPKLVLTSFSPEEYDVTVGVRLYAYKGQPDVEALFVQGSGAYSSGRLSLSAEQTQGEWRPIGDAIVITPPSIFNMYLVPPQPEEAGGGESDGGGSRSASAAIVEEMGYTALLTGVMPKRAASMALNATGIFTADLSDVCFAVRGVSVSSMDQFMQARRLRSYHTLPMCF